MVYKIRIVELVVILFTFNTRHDYVILSDFAYATTSTKIYSSLLVQVTAISKLVSLAVKLSKCQAKFSLIS